MDFGEILERWEKSQQPQEKPQPRVDMGRALERFPPGPGEGQAREGPGKPQEGSERGPRDAAPQAELDLHGMSALEAETAIDRFLRDARNRGLSKVLLIHGKGNHSPGEPVLQRVVRDYLEKCPFTGAFGRAERARGGGGATWVRIRNGSYRSR
jgi:DNA-nicking Smr family endonuclease